MDVTRRDLLKLLAIAAASGLDPRRLEADDGPERLLEFEPLGNVTLLHVTDAHATTRPVFYRAPDTLIGFRYERGVDVLTAHWEFVYGIDRGRELFGDRARTGLFAGDFVAQNGRELGWNDRGFRPYTIRRVGGVSVGVIGQAFPYTPVSHPRRF